MRKRATLVSVAVVMLLLTAVACKEQDILKAAQAAKSFQISVAAFQAGEIEAYRLGYVSDADHKAIQQGIEDVAIVGIELDNAIRVAKSKPQALAAVSKAFDAIDRLSAQGVLRVKNPQSQLALQALLAAARTAVATIQAVI